MAKTKNTAVRVTLRQFRRSSVQFFKLENNTPKQADVTKIELSVECRFQIGGIGPHALDAEKFLPVIEKAKSFHLLFMGRVTNESIEITIGTNNWEAAMKEIRSIVKSSAKKIQTIKE
jgi:hypothetical protein